MSVRAALYVRHLSPAQPSNLEEGDHGRIAHTGRAVVGGTNG